MHLLATDLPGKCAIGPPLPLDCRFRQFQREDARTRDVAASTKWQIWGRCSYAAIRATSSLPTSRNRSTAVRSALRPGSPGSISASASSAVTWAAATTRPAGMR